MRKKEEKRERKICMLVRRMGGRERGAAEKNERSKVGREIKSMKKMGKKDKPDRNEIVEGLSK